MAPITINMFIFDDIYWVAENIMGLNNHWWPYKWHTGWRSF